VILLFRLVGCLRGIGFCEVIQTVIFLSPLILKAGIVNHTDNLVFGLKVCDTSYFFSVFVRSKITILTGTDIFVVPYNAGLYF
jgi:hypothetical protein